MAILLSSGILVRGQTNPALFDLSTGPYTFTAWDSASPAGTYPPNMVFQYVPANQTAPFYTDGTSDFNCQYNKTKRPRINGLMNKGIGIITTSSSQYNDCNSGAADSHFLGVILLSVNTTGRNNITVSWKSETITPGDGSPTEPRVWNLRLQYRIGHSGIFTDVPGPVEFVSSIASGDSVQFGPTMLPDECNKQAEVQLRWIYFETFAGISGGSRPQLRLDDIEVNSDATVGLAASQTKNQFNIYPNPATDYFTVTNSSGNTGIIQLTDPFGRVLKQQSFNPATSAVDCTDLPKGIYFVKVTVDGSGETRTRKLIKQ